MKAALFGATGETGKYLIDEALKRGIEVTVFARSSSSFENPDVRVVRGDLSDRNLLKETIHGSDAVLSAIGPSSLKHPKDLPITRAMEAIISVMKEENVKRLIAVSTGTAVDPGDAFDLKIWLPAQIIRMAMPGVYRDIIGLSRTVRASGLDWTMVRVGFLKSRPASGGLNVGLYGHAEHSLTVSREDVARFMFNQITSQEFIKQAPGISAR